MKFIVRTLIYIKSYWLLSTGVLGSLLLASLFTLSIPTIIQRIIDNGIDAGVARNIIIGAFLMVAVALLGALFSFLQNYWAAKASQNVAFDLRNDLYEKIHKLSFGYHDRAQTGQLLTRATNDVDRVQMFLGRGLVTFITAVIMLLGAITLLILIDWQLALIMLLVIPITMVIMIYFVSRARPLFMRIQGYLSSLNTVLQENLAGVRVVKAFAREDYESTRFARSNEKLTNKNIEVGRMLAKAFPLVFLIANIGTLLVIWLGGLQVIGGRLTIGELVAFQNYLFMVTFPMMMFGMILAFVAQASASSERIFEILDAESEVIENDLAYALPQVKGRVEFKKVWFRYFGEHTGTDKTEESEKKERKSIFSRLNPKHHRTGGMSGMGMGMTSGAQPDEPDLPEWVLQDVSFTVEPGQVIALLGMTGSGKSTIVNLIPRFYDVTRGGVKIDGVDVREVTLDSLRSQIGMVMQQTTLFTGTIRENIAYGRSQATEEEVIAAAKAAEAHDFIMEFSDGYNTQVGERGTTLSGGQKQRIAIARALLLNPQILILDDSTSSVDLQTEYRIQQALQQLMQNRTSFVIAQRISTVRSADLILVLDQGKIAAQGTHTDLMHDSAVYAEIFSSQLQHEDELMFGLDEENPPQIREEATQGKREVV
jgi:ATP-binding cassette subfamily B protein